MSYTVNWYIPNEIIYAHYSGIVTGDEMRECLSKMHELMNSSPRQLIHAISDIGDVIENVPFKDSMKIVREVGHHPKSGWMITVHEKSHVVKMGSAIAASVFRLRFRAFDNMDQVIAHLKNYDKSLSWDKVNLSIYSVKA